MKKKKIHKLFSAIMALAMVFTMLAPLQISANDNAIPIKQSGANEGIMQAQTAITEQLTILDGPATLHEDLQGLSGEQEVSVIVHLSEKPVALEKGIKELAGQKFTRTEAASVEKKVNAQQGLVKKEMTINKISYKEGYSYDTVLNGFAMTVKADDLKKLLEIDGVVLIEPDEMRYALGNPAKEGGQVDAAMVTSIPFLGVENLWKNGIEGQTVKVGVLDTGIDYNHPEFEGVYKGGKNYITHGSTYARTRLDNDPYETSPLDRKSTTPEFDSQGSSFYTSHGTHVAGTIAAIGVNEYGIKGLAPKVELYAYRVLGAYGSGATAGIIKAIDDSVKDGMHVINLSLGGSSNSAIASDAIAINNAMLGGTVAVIATGNSGPNRGTIGNPSTAALGIAVGNSTNPEQMFEAGVTVSAGSYSKTSTIKLMGVKFGESLEDALKGEFDVVAIPNVGTPKDFTGIDVKGKVALISRGDIAFVDKIANAKAAGAKAALIHNSPTGTNSPGPADVFLGDSFEFIPAFDMSYTEGKALRDALGTGTGTGKVSFSNITSSKTTGDTMNSSSSRGPANPDFDLKPDVVAPGTNIMSSVAAYGKDFPDADYSESYDRYTGTSMATPHIAGIAALIRQANPTWTPFDVKVALSNTAKVLDTKAFDVFAQGPGRVQPYEAAYPTILAYALSKTTFSGKEYDNEKGTVTFGRLDKVKDENVTVKKQIRVKDVKGEGGDYSVRVETLKSFSDAKITVNKPTFTLNGEEMLELTLTISKTAPKTTDELLGYIYIEGNGIQVSLPFAATFTPLTLPTGVHHVEVADHDVSFNGDKVKDETNVSFQLVGRFGANYVGVYDLLVPDGLDDSIGYIVYSTGRNAGMHKVPITGTYTNWEIPGVTQIPEGAYIIEVIGQSGANVYAGYDFEPLFVVNSPATVDTAESHTTVGPNYTFNGTIVDKYIDFQEPLDEIGFGFDVHEKLFVTYELTNSNGEKVSEGPVNFAQDGAFSLNLSKLTVGDNTVTIYVDDAAGNKAEYDYTVVAEVKLGLSVSPANLELTVGDTEQLEVTVTEKFEEGTETIEELIEADADDIGTIEEVTETDVDDIGTIEEVTETDADDIGTIEESTETEAVVSGTVELEEDDNGSIEEGPDEGEGEDEFEVIDVAEFAEYSGYDENIITIEKGKVRAVGVGTTTITVSHKGLEETVEVVVKPLVTLSVDTTDLSIEKGKTATIKVTETTTITIEGEHSIDDVTAEAAYAVADNSIVTVDKGVITAKAAGTTTITITHGDNTKTVNVTVTNPVDPVTPGNGGGGSGGGSGGGYFPSTPSTPKPTEPGTVKPVPTPPTLVTFTDTAGHWAELYIQKATALGVFNGYSDGTFRPNNHLTRAQAASLMVRALGLQTDEAAPFDDIANYDDATKAEIAAAYKYGIIKGNDGNFNPSDRVTRAQIALMIARAYEFKTGEKYTPMAIASFSDYGNFNKETVNAITILYDFEIVSGFEGKFMPNDPTTRAQAAKIFINLMEKLQQM
ncbi:S8 family serine peptidase [Sporosarcina sp. YIM B06819]|uniref:S8 family serine peptidase n=1 Tax=Sporosarcina sp. YIM B06819 TaxID=3081769 RepID=UPI00298CE689|nr:S8 family serine peptidase [Sporosarcina sp. YIM B06819]